MQRKKYSPEFKHEAVELVRRSQTSCRQIALEIGINPNMLTRWVREAEGPADKAFTGKGRPTHKRRLQCTIARLSKERQGNGNDQQGLQPFAESCHENWQHRYLQPG